MKLNKQIEQALRFIEEHGIVLEAGHGPAPNLARQVLGSIQGSWWSHPRAKEFFWLTRAIRENPEILVCRLVNGKITYVHRRLWPALVRLANDLGPEVLTAVREVHTRSGKHEVEETPYPKWVPSDVAAAARQLDEGQVTQELRRYPSLAAVLTSSVPPQTPRTAPERSAPQAHRGPRAPFRR